MGGWVGVRGGGGIASGDRYSAVNALSSLLSCVGVRRPGSLKDVMRHSQVGAESPPSMQVGSEASAVMVSEVL